jgi:hypothetical protein
VGCSCFRASLKQKKVFSKGLKDIIKALLPAKEVYCKKSTGTIYIDKRKLLTLHLVGEHGSRIDWDDARRISFGLDDATAETQFKAWVDAKMGSFP